MALTLVQHKNGATTANQATCPVTVTSTGAGHLLVCATGVENSGYTVTGVSDGTNPFTQFTGARATNTLSTPTFANDIWYLLSSAAGKTTITVTFSTGDTTQKSAEVWEVSGFTSPATDGATPVSNSAGVGTTFTGGAVVTTSTTGFVVGTAQAAAGISQNPKTGNEFISGGDLDAGGRGWCSLISSTAASHTPVWLINTSADKCLSCTAAFKESSGGSSSTPGNTKQFLMLTGLGT